MLTDLESGDAPPVFEGDLCIVGAGAAGQTLARRMAGRNCRVILVESGGIDYEADIAALGAGENAGFPYYDLEDSRLRFFGGTTAIWGGRCAELDPIDFVPRDWVPWSGWPFRKDALAPYYDQARAQLRLDAPPRAEEFWALLGIEPPVLGEDVVSNNLWQFDRQWDRFGFAANESLATNEGMTIVLRASVTGLDLDESGTAVVSAQLRTLGGRRAQVRAKYFVLAAGGLENPRILLASNTQAPQGIGNDHDLVGRFFMEHPHARGGRLHLRRPWPVLSAYRQSLSLNGHRYAATLRVSDHLQRRRQILNTSFTPRVRRHPGARQNLALQLYSKLKHDVAPTRRGRTAWRIVKQLVNGITGRTDPLVPWLQLQSDSRGLYLSLRAEQAPNPGSRVRLSATRDAVGMPQIALDWRFSEIDKRSVRVLVKELDAELRRTEAGSVEPADWLDDDGMDWQIDPLIGQHPIGGYHHIGTTRMATSPRNGVVDADSRVHGIDNLYIAGSSVFPTSGWANPTLTILALTHRLADHLKQRVSAS